MSRIRKLYYFDKKDIQEMISFLNNRDTLVNHLVFNPLIPLHYILPLRFKFLPETYVLKDKKSSKGLITVTPSKSAVKKMEILKLFFEENCYEDAGELVQFVVSKYKALGAVSFVARIDDYLPELLKLFVTRCCFSQISYEKLWKVKNFSSKDFNKKDFRKFRNTDASVVSNLYNESLLPHIRPLLSKDTNDFKESLFRGLEYYDEHKFVIEDRKTKNITGYVSIQSIDNENFILDVVQSSWVDLDIQSVISFAAEQIRKKKKDFSLFIKTKRYTQLGEKQEELFMQEKFECVQNQIVLTNSSAKIIREESATRKFTVLSPYYGRNLANQ